MTILGRLRLQTRLFIAYSLVVGMIIVGALSSFYYYVAGNLEQSARENLDQLCLKSTEQIDSFLSEIDHLALQIVTNKTVQNAFIQASEWKSNHTDFYFERNLDVSREVTGVLAAIDGPNITATRISLFTQNGDYLSYGKLQDDQDAISARMKSKDFQAGVRYWHTFEGGRIILPQHTDFWSNQKDILLISLIREIRDINHSYGFLEIQQPYSYFESKLRLTTLPNIKVNVYAPDHSVVLGKVLTEETGYQIVTSRKSLFSGWTVTLVEDKKLLLFPIQTLRNTMIWIGCALLFVTLSVIFIITRKLTKPLNQLTLSIRKVSLNNMAVDLNNDHNSNEIVQLNRAFDKMFNRLKSSMDELVHARAQELNAQFKALQSQLNPHFLYNVLSIVSAAGQDAGVPKIMELCHKLSSMLRYITTYNEKGVSIEDEVNHARDYLELMKARYEDHFSYRLDCEEPSLSVAVPKMILQPLIENCFQHAFSHVAPPWYVNVTVTLKDQKWIMRIEDNGKGFDRHLLDALLKKVENFYSNPTASMQDLQISGLGLHHTIVRLKLLYGDSMIFEVEDNVPRGTCITIGGG